MRARTLVLTAVVVASVIAGGGAGAAGTKTDANTFATSTAFCGTGAFTVMGSLTVKGGSGVIPTPNGCTVTMSDNSKLSFVGATISAGNPNASFQIVGGAHASVTFKKSTLTIPNTLNIQPGLSGISQFVSGDRGSVKVVGSTISGGDLRVTASYCGTDGHVKVKKSTLTSTGSGGLLLLAASIGTTGDARCVNGPGSGGRIRVNASTLKTNNGNLIVETETKGVTKVVKNTLTSPQIHIHSGGKCVSKHNNPNPPCT